MDGPFDFSNFEDKGASTGTKENFGAIPKARSSSKSVRWADQQELRDVMEFDNVPKVRRLSLPDTRINISAESHQDELRVVLSDRLPLISDLAAKSIKEESQLTSSATQSEEEGNKEKEEEAKQTALSELILHLEDTAALLRQYLEPPSTSSDDDLGSYQQTHFLLKYQLILVVFSQTVSILILTLFDHLTSDTGYVILTRLTGTILQLINMLLVIFATVILSKQMLKYKVEGSFLSQTYIATVITFAGLYFIIYRFQPSSWEFGSVDKIEDTIAIGQYIKMLYLSVSAATLCGAANIQPRTWYVTLLLCFQSLINFVYFASILAQTIGNYHSYTVQVRRSSSMSRLPTSKYS